jgi:hypothetical protein
MSADLMQDGASVIPTAYHKVVQLMTERNRMWWPLVLCCTCSLLKFGQLVPITQMPVSESGTRNSQLLLTDGNYSFRQGICIVLLKRLHKIISL